MSMWQAIERAALRPVYALAIWLRGRLWRLRRPVLVGVRALIVRDGRVLLIRHRSGVQPWSLPGGGVERYERLAEAACREAAEEAGVDVRVEELLGVYDHFGGGVTNYVAVFVCAPPSAAPNPPRSIEIAEARFFPLRALPRDADPGTRRRVAEYLAGERGVSKVW
jgi:ADP-ribose pyrophosphatase YjhB (NUDIX family)